MIIKTKITLWRVVLKIDPPFWGGKTVHLRWKSPESCAEIICYNFSAVRWGMQLDPHLTWSTDLARRLDRCIFHRSQTRQNWSTSNLLHELTSTCRSVCIFLNIKSGSNWSTSNLIRGFILTSRSVHFPQHQVILGVDQVAFLVIKRSIFEICIGAPYLTWKTQDFEENIIFSSR